MHLKYKDTMSSPLAEDAPPGWMRRYQSRPCMRKGWESVQSPFPWGNVSKEWKWRVVRAQPVGRRGVPTSIVCIKEFIAVLGLVENDDDDEVCFGRLYLCMSMHQF